MGQLPQGSSAEEAYEYINDTLTPQVIEFFKAKQTDYSGGPAFMFLGVKGQFADINRKFWKLYKCLWNDEPLDGESSEEILMDFVGHCLLTIYAIRKRDEQPRREVDESHLLAARKICKQCGDEFAYCGGRHPR